MPYRVVEKEGTGRYQVVSLNPDGSIKNVHMKGGTRSNAWAQKRILDEAKYGGHKPPKKYHA